MTTEVILVKAAQLILSLSILVVLHELGHFIPAKLFKTRVEKFYLFFDPWFSLFKFKKGETEYGVGWLPLGGYVKISGMIDESMDREQMAKPPQPWEFRSKPTWQRLIIMIGGVTVNILLAFFIYAMTLWVWGDTYLPNASVKYGVVTDSLARSIGMQDGDKIVAIDHRPVEKFESIAKNILLHEAKSIQVNREGKELNLTVPEGFGNALLKQRGAFVMPRMPYIADSTRAGSAAAKVGVQSGDRLIAINGMDVPFYDQFAKEIKKHKSEDVIVSVVRGKDTLNLAAKLSEKGEFGVYPRLMLNLDTTKYTFLQALPAGVSESVDKLVSYVQQLRLIFVSKEVKVTESVGGFMTIGNLFPEMWDWRVFWEMTAFLSIVLAFMNILPIPGLDGGHVLFLLYEIVTGRKPNEKFMEYAQIAGMLILLSLLLFANGLDLWRNLLKKFF